MLRAVCIVRNCVTKRVLFSGCCLHSFASAVTRITQHTGGRSRTQEQTATGLRRRGRGRETGGGDGRGRGGGGVR